MNKKNKDQPESEIADNRSDKSSSISRIIWFYENNSFEEYFPRR